MAPSRPVLLDEHHPIPTRSLWRLLKTFDISLDDRGIAAKGYDEIHRAYDTVTAWLGRVEGEFGYPSFGENRNAVEIDPDQAKIGGCPFCYLNDGIMTVGEDVWAVCHQHHSRWKIDPELLEIGFLPDGSSVWDTASSPAQGYAEVTPVFLTARKNSPRFSFRQLLAARLFSRKA